MVAGPIPFTSSASGCVPSTSIVGGPVVDTSGDVPADCSADDGTADDSVCNEDIDDLRGSRVDDTLSSRSSYPRSGMGMGADEALEFRRSLSLRSSTAARISA